MDSLEFTEWQEMFLIQPFGDAIADRRHGDKMALLATAHFGSAEKRFSSSDFMLGISAQALAAEDAEPEFIDDPIAQSNLIRAAIFGIGPKNPT